MFEYDYENENWQETHLPINEDDYEVLDLDFSKLCDKCRFFIKTVHYSGISWLGYCTSKPDIFNPKHVLNTDKICDLGKQIRDMLEKYNGKYQCIKCKGLFNEVTVINKHYHYNFYCKSCEPKED